MDLGLNYWQLAISSGPVGHPLAPFGWIWALNWKNAPHLGCGTCHEGTSWKVYFPDLDVIRCNILSTRLKVVHGWLFCYNGSSNLFRFVSFRPCWEVKQTFETYCGWYRFGAWIEIIKPLPETEITPGSRPGVPRHNSMSHLAIWLPLGPRVAC
jgi:hypothetical protein